MEQGDHYAKLRPPPPTPAEELCACPDTPPIKLMYALSANPIHCMDCNREVAPEGLRLSASQVDAVAFWCWIHAAIDHLWLASSEYEQWAQKQLSDISSPVCRLGRQAQAELNATRRCYYWYFQDQTADNHAPLNNCPLCGLPLTGYTAGIFLQRVCEACSIVVSAE